MLTLARYLELSTPAELSETKRCSAHLQKPLALGTGFRYTRCLPIKHTTGMTAITEQLFVQALLELGTSLQRREAGRTRGVCSRATAVAQRAQTHLAPRHKIKCTHLAHYMQNTTRKQHCLRCQTETLKNKNTRLVTPITSAIHSAIAFSSVCLGVLIL